MPKYSTENKQIIRQIIAIGKKRGESKKEIKAALLTGRVEANFSNPKVATDHDSLGWRQERQMYYKNPTNVKASINRFFDETSKKGNGRGMNSGQLAQAVQRSAFPDRYNMHSKEAEGLLRRYGSISGGKSAPRVDTQAPGRSDALRTLLMQSVSNPSRETALTGSNIATALLTGNKEPVASEQPKKLSRPSRGSGGNPWKVPAKYGLTVTSGRRPGAITSSGNVSDHAESEPGTIARDYGGSPAQMDKAARAIARELGIKNYRPGNYTTVTKGKYRYQLIYKVPDGSHDDHVHLGRKRVK